MDKVIDAKINMFDNVDYELQRNPLIVDNSPAFRIMTDHLHNELGEIRDIIQTLVLSTKGLAERKRKAKNQASLLLSSVCGAIRSYATAVNNADLYQQAALSYSRLRQARDVEFVEVADALYALAVTVQPQLVDYNVNVQMMADVQAAINLFRTYNVEPRASKVLIKTNRKLVYDRVWVLNDYLNEQMDNVVLTFRYSHPEFYELYHNARRNYSLGVRHRQPLTEEEEAMMQQEAEMQQRLKSLRQQEARLKKQAEKLKRLEAELNRQEAEAQQADGALPSDELLRGMVEDIHTNGIENGEPAG